MRAYLLLIIAVLMLSDTAVILTLRNEYLASRAAASRIEFRLDLQRGVDIEFGGGELPQLPIFDPSQSVWKFDGHEIDDLAQFVDRHDLGNTANSSQLIFNLPADATMGDYQASIVSLAGMGICSVGVQGPAPEGRRTTRNYDDSEWPSLGYVSVYQIDECEDRVQRSKPAATVKMAEAISHDGSSSD